jgi:hypothetical protein
MITLRFLNLRTEIEAQSFHEKREEVRVVRKMEKGQASRL